MSLFQVREYAEYTGCSSIAANVKQGVNCAPV